MTSQPFDGRATPTDDSCQITIVIVDDQAILREGVRLILDKEPGMHVVGEAGSIAEACDVITETSPDVVLLDLSLRNESAVDRLEEIRECAPDSKILLLTGVIDEAANARAAEKGAMGIVLKNQHASILVSAIRKVHAGEVWFDRAFTARLIRDANKRITSERAIVSVFSRLTCRELEIATKIGEGLVNKDIARSLGISEKTVRNCLSTIYAKLGIETRLELAVLLGKHHRIS